MTELEKMRSGKLYRAWLEDLPQLRLKAQTLCWQFNALSPLEMDRREEILRRLLGRVGKTFYMEPPFRCDYGFHISIGENFYSNYNLIILDCAPVTIGNNVFLAPNVAIYAAGHPVDAALRNSGLEYSQPVTIGDDVWVGGNTVINPGVTIGSDVVIGSGSVVTRDIPSHCIAASNPCRVLRALTPEDRNYYFRRLPVSPEELALAGLDPQP